MHKHPICNTFHHLYWLNEVYKQRSFGLEYSYYKELLFDFKYILIHEEQYREHHNNLDNDINKF